MLFEVIGVVVVLVLLYYHLGTSTYNHWVKKGIPGDRPTTPFLGSSKPLLKQEVTLLDNVVDMRNRFKQYRYAGFFNFRTPVLCINDPELIKLVLVKDFDHFVNRNVIISANGDPVVGRNLLSIGDQRWKDMRNVLSPTFTSAKMKNMFFLINECGEQVKKFLTGEIDKQINNNHKDGEVYKMDVKELFTRFSNDVIATTAFGIKVDSLSNPDNEFYQTARTLTKVQARQLLVIVLYLAMPWLMEKLKVTFFGAKINKYYTDLVLNSVMEKEKNKIIRPDMLHLMMQAKKEAEGEGKGKKPVLTDEDLVSQTTLFYLAGFETISTFLGFCAHELAVNPDVQKRLIEEIDSVIESEDGQITYDGVMIKMKYLEAVCSEVLRKWPPAVFTDRKVSKPYKIEGKNGEPNLYLKRGDVVMVPIAALHRDPKYFPNPDVFDPERFNEENKHKIEPFTYMPFGTGPRNCIGMRFAIMEGKACLVHILRNFTFEVIPETQIPLKLTKKTTQMGPENGFWVGIKPRKG